MLCQAKSGQANRTTFEAVAGVSPRRAVHHAMPGHCRTWGAPGSRQTAGVGRLSGSAVSLAGPWGAGSGLGLITVSGAVCCKRLDAGPGGAAFDRRQRNGSLGR